jgi:hypothetical protein
VCNCETADPPIGALQKLHRQATARCKPRLCWQEVAPPPAPPPAASAALTVDGGLHVVKILEGPAALDRGGLHQHDRVLVVLRQAGKGEGRGLWAGGRGAACTIASRYAPVLTMLLIAPTRHTSGPLGCSKTGGGPEGLRGPVCKNG